MPRKNPLDKLKDVADVAVATVTTTVKHPVGTGQKVVGTAVGQAFAVAGAVGAKVSGRKKAGPAPQTAPRPELVPDAAQRREESSRPHGDPLEPAVSRAVKAPSKTSTKKPPVEGSATQKPPAQKIPAQKMRTETAPAEKAAAKKVPTAGAPAAGAPAKKAPAKKAPAKKAPLKKAPSKKAAVTAPARAAAKKAAARRPAKKAADLVTVDDSSVETPVGTTGADLATNPDTTDTDLQQVGTPPLVDSSLTKAIKKEAQTGARAADTDKG